MIMKLKILFSSFRERAFDLAIVSMVALLVILMDQYSKYYMLDMLREKGTIEVIPGAFSFALSFNKGAAFGIFAGIESDLIRFALLVVFSLFALVGGVVIVFREFNGKLANIALALIVGGGVGNIIDRVRLGMVIDFLDVFYRSYHWPTFNLADVGVTTGVSGLIILSFTSAHISRKRKLCTESLDL